MGQRNATRKETQTNKITKNATTAAVQRIVWTYHSSKDIYIDLQARIDFIRETIEVGDYSDALDSAEGLVELLRDLNAASIAA